jgi:ribose-phosphate pyrophosphokinase
VESERSPITNILWLGRYLANHRLTPKDTNVKLISGNSNLELAKRISQYAGTTLVKANIGRFADGEVRAEIFENVRGQDVFVIQSTSSPVNENFMELVVMVDALRRASARRITAVLPYYGYARQDRKMTSRAPISAKLMANLLTTSGVDRVLTLDLHAGQIQGFFDIPVDTLYARPILVSDIRNRLPAENLIFVSPDAGGTERARSYAKKFNTDIAIIDKRRPEPGASEVMNVVGDVEGKQCIIVDDIVDSAGTLCNAATALIDRGATKVRAYIAHGVLSPKADSNINNSNLTEMVTTDSIKPDREFNIPTLRQVTVAPLLARAIVSIHNEQSVSSLLEDDWDDFHKFD